MLWLTTKLIKVTINLELQKGTVASSVADPGSQDPNFSVPDPGTKGSRIRIRIIQFNFF
jgi:hypothetical protein